jgi:hypothetical protein
MTSTNDDVDLAPSVAAGYKVTEKKTVGEYAALDAKYPLKCETPCLLLSSDESLKKWKASLGITGETIPSDPNDPRKVRLIHRMLTLVPRWSFSNWL